MRLGDYNSALTSYTYAADAAPGIAGYRLREAQLLFEVRSVHQALPAKANSCGVHSMLHQAMQGAACNQLQDVGLLP